jgi:hypothetical protein
LLKGGEMLAAVWVTAQRAAVSDPYLRANLLKREQGADGKTPPKKRAPSKKKPQ